MLILAAHNSSSGWDIGNFGFQMDTIMTNKVHSKADAFFSQHATLASFIRIDYFFRAFVTAGYSDVCVQ
jgi:hypothetical protein